MSVNLLILTGRISQPPKLFDPIVKVSVATSRTVCEGGVERSQEQYTTVTFRHPRLARQVLENIKVGDTVHITAHVEDSVYKSNGVKRWNTDVIANSCKRLSNLREDA